MWRLTVSLPSEADLVQLSVELIQVQQAKGGTGFIDDYELPTARGEGHLAARANHSGACQSNNRSFRSTSQTLTVPFF